MLRRHFIRNVFHHLKMFKFQRWWNGWWAEMNSSSHNVSPNLNSGFVILVWNYLFTVNESGIQFDHFSFPVCFIFISSKEIHWLGNIFISRKSSKIHSPALNKHSSVRIRRRLAFGEGCRRPAPSSGGGANRAPGTGANHLGDRPIRQRTVLPSIQPIINTILSLSLSVSFFLNYFLSFK